jgi:hypothetical protein
MDLGTCPKCGISWIAGRDQCRSCRYIAIGAGLQGYKKKRRKRFGAYVEPGSWRPVGVLFLIAASGLVGYTKPWTDNFKQLKMVIGLKPPTLTGEWVVKKVFRLNKKAELVIRDSQMKAAVLSFKKQDHMSLLTELGSEEPFLTSRVNFEDEIMHLYSIKSKGTGAPSEVKFTLKWISDDLVQATRPDKESWLIQRVGGKEKITKFWSSTVTGNGELEKLMKESSEAK